MRLRAFAAGTLQEGGGRGEFQHHGNGVRWQAALRSALRQGDGGACG